MTLEKEENCHPNTAKNQNHDTNGNFHNSSAVSRYLSW